MKAILIDAKNKVVSMINTTGDLGATYTALNVDMIQVGYYDDNNGDTLYVDEEGMLNGTDFGFKLFGRTFYGNGILYGSTIEGDNASVKTDINSINPTYVELSANPKIPFTIISF